MSQSEQISQKNLNVAINYKYFLLSFIELLNLFTKQSNNVDLKTLDMSIKKNVNLVKNHKKFRETCDILKNGFSVDDNDDFDKGKIVKKIYKVLTQHLDKLYPNPDISLFSLTNENDEKITIIPGLDIGLVIKLLSDEELKTMWTHIYMLYISSVGMISVNNSHKKEGKVWELLPKLREKVAEFGINANGQIFNPFIGLQSETGEYDVNAMFSGISNIQKPSEGQSIENILKLTGIDKLVDINQLNDQLKNVKQEDIEEATRNITKLLGAENDSDISEVCGTLVQNIVKDLKDNPDGGIKNMFDVAKSVSEKVGKTIDRRKMKKTARQLTDFLKNGESNLQNMKDDKGNPIGKNIMNSLSLPLKLAQSYNMQNTDDADDDIEKETASSKKPRQKN